MSNLNRGSDINIGGGQIRFSKEEGLKEADLMEIPQELRDTEIPVKRHKFIKEKDGMHLCRIDESGKILGRVTPEEFNKIKAKYLESEEYKKREARSKKATSKSAGVMEI